MRGGSYHGPQGVSNGRAEVARYKHAVSEEEVAEKADRIANVDRDRVRKSGDHATVVIHQVRAVGAGIQDRRETDDLCLPVPLPARARSASRCSNRPICPNSPICPFWPRVLQDCWRLFRDRWLSGWETLRDRHFDPALRSGIGSGVVWRHLELALNHRSASALERREAWGGGATNERRFGWVYRLIAGASTAAVCS